jgi:hypothetical protein
MDIQDSPLGVRAADYVTAFPAGINAAATYVLFRHSQTPPLGKCILNIVAGIVVSSVSAAFQLAANMQERA